MLYEALDFFQSCYSNNQRHQQQHPQFNKDISATTDDNNDEYGSSSQRNLITSVPISDVNGDAELASSSHESVDCIIESIREFDSEETIANQSNRSVFSICDRVNHFNRQPLIDYHNDDKNAHFNDYDKLIDS